MSIEMRNNLGTVLGFIPLILEIARSVIKAVKLVQLCKFLLTSPPASCDY